MISQVVFHNYITHSWGGVDSAIRCISKTSQVSSSCTRPEYRKVNILSAKNNFNDSIIWIRADEAILKENDRWKIISFFTLMQEVAKRGRIYQAGKTRSGSQTTIAGIGINHGSRYKVHISNGIKAMKG